MCVCVCMCIYIYMCVCVYIYIYDCGEGNSTSLQYSCLENPMDKEPGRLQSMGLLRVGHD